MMSTLVKNLDGVLGHGQEATDIRFNKIKILEVGSNLEEAPNETIIDGKNCIAYPGFVNTHHHLAQSVLKGIPAGLNQPLGNWLASVPYRYWPQIKPDLMYHAAKLGLYEGLRSGMTTCADHHYLYHSNSTPELEDAVWQAASDLGVRFVLCRGGANVIGSHKGLKDAGIQPESLDQTLNRLQKSMATYHQAEDHAMRKLVVAPTSLIHSSTEHQLKELARFARQNKLRLHSHLLEVDFDQVQSRKQNGMDAIDYAEQCEWLGDDVWFAHLVKADQHTINKLSKTGTGIAHCPTSNCRLGSGIAPIIEMENAGMTISLGVDGSASSESASMLQEVNLSWLLHRATHGASATTIDKVTEWATVGGAKTLGYKNLGELKVGQIPDMVLYDISATRYCGVHQTNFAPIMLGEPATVKYSFIQGSLVVHNGAIKNCNEADLTMNITKELAKLI
jgi:cytosine/adenosine deaminase-related metal-dependent hydrolase